MVKLLSSIAVVAVALIGSFVSAVPLDVGALARRDMHLVNTNYIPQNPQTVTVTVTKYVNSNSPSSYYTSAPSSYTSTTPPTQFPDWQNQMLSQVNSIRASAGMPPLTLDSRLNDMAQSHSNYQDSISQMTHSDSAGSLGQRCTDVGLQWRGVAENVAYNYPDVTSVVQGWKNSPGHYANMIGDYSLVGFGVNNKYWTQDFAKL
ncbi:hypothetical protein GGI21_004105 [Coemansia aciculifera]|uniref:Uncharacterized protein n=1 Tax=Coemansia aciculifera TaxID=417176 RepID=A0ACC1MA64_9FUNG|nr:hypothetical protein IWW38_000695 [Coemansia aciculifera]KAJ2905961.1 hypothetical protein GGI21_004105 [Coemansia aciculifera]